MRIISSFHDYYDTAQGFGIDPNLIYRRDCEKLEIKEWKWDQSVKTLLDIYPPGWKQTECIAVLGFCNRIYPVWIDSTVVADVGVVTNDTGASLLLTKEELEIRWNVRNSHFPTWQRRRYGFDFSYARIKRIIQPLVGAKISSAQFVDLSAPIFLAFATSTRYPSNRTFILFKNPRLALFDFVKHFDPFAAYQEISMYLGSILAPEDRAPRTVGGDKIIAASKGFDEQSFRTAAPGQKKVNREANKARKKRQDSP